LHDLISDQFGIDIHTYLQTFDNRYNDPNPWFPEKDFHKNKSFGFDGQVRWTVNSHWIMDMGTEMRQDRLNSTKFAMQKRVTQSLFLQSEIVHRLSICGKNTHWTWNPAIRLDRIEGIGFHACPKIGILVSTGEDENLSVRGNIGNSFRSPTFNDLYWPEVKGFGWATRGNPNLSPETGTCADLGFVFRKNNPILLNLELTCFINKIDNLIIWESDQNNTYSPRNIGRSQVIGIENEWSFRLPENRFYFLFVYTAMKAIDQTPGSMFSGYHLIYRPDIKVDLRSGLNLHRISMNFNYQFVGSRYSLPDNSKTLPDYQLFNSNIGYSFPFFGASIEIKLQLQNILNKTIFILDGYPLPRREFRLSFGIRY
jgi:outer membrane cobalamin receptor